MQVFCFILFDLTFWLCKLLKTFDSLHAWHTMIRAFSACSETNWFVSVAFLIKAPSTRSMLGSRSFVGNSWKITWRVIQAFLETWDLKLSVCFTISLIASFYPGFAMISLWNRATLLIIFRLSKIFCQSSYFKFYMLYLNYCSAFLNGSSGALYVVLALCSVGYGDRFWDLFYCLMLRSSLTEPWMRSLPVTELALWIWADWLLP